ncbi:MAG: beta-aspartyl-peptidase [Pseudomonadota bacterium]
MQLLLNADTFAPEPLGLQHLLVGGGKILWLGQDVPSLDQSLGVETVDLGGRRVTPGFLDMHAHVTGGGGESGFASRVPPVAINAFTRAGVTTVVGLLGTDDSTRTTEDLVAKTRGLREEGITGLCFTGGYHIPPTTLTGCVRKDIVSVDPIIGVGEIAISDHRSSQPTLDELLRLAADSHVAGMMTGKAGILHLHLGDGERRLDLVNQALDQSEIPPRVFNPTHINRNPDLFEAAKTLSHRGCYVDITAFPVVEGDIAIPAHEAWLDYMESGHDLSKLTMSSDGGGCLPQFDQDGQITHMDVGAPLELSNTLALLLSAGVSLERVLPSLTSNVARLLRLETKGVIQANADADLVVLDKNNRIDGVMASGGWHRFDGKQRILGRFEQRGES